MMVLAEELLEFWLCEVGPERWYVQDEELDETIRKLFEREWEALREGMYAHWLVHPRGTLAYIVFTDQLPRNMFRGQAKAFATDWQARTAAKAAVDKGWDLRVDEPGRQFFYLPLMHSENLCDQERCVRLILERAPQTGVTGLLHARAHREVIRRFGRFPYRNQALNRETTPAEADFVDQGGYGAVVRSLQAGGSHLL